MNIPKTPEEAKLLEEKIRANQKAGDWVEIVFPEAGISIPSKLPVETFLKTVGETRLPKKPKS